MKKKLTRRLIYLSLTLTIIFLFILLKDKVNLLIFQKNMTKPFVKIEKEKIAKIILESENKKIELYKKGGQWYLKDKNLEIEADQERILKTIDALIALEKKEIVSKNKNKHQEFGINKKKITFFDKKDKFVVYIGNNYGLSQNYVRIDNQDEVFLGHNLNDVFTNLDWRNLSVPLINKEEAISQVEINLEEKKTILKREKDNWLVNKNIAKKDRVDFFLNDLSTLKANDILFSKDAPNLIWPELTIIINEDKKTKIAEFFKKDKDNYLLKISSNNLVYQINTPYVASLKKEEVDFIQ